MERSNDQYHFEIRQAAHMALRAGVDSLEELCQACAGAYPGDIHALVQDGPYAEEVEELLDYKSSPKDVSVFKDGPDPSPTDYEWRFTKETARELADVIKARGGNVLCLGTPTIFWALKGCKEEVVLVDRNPYLLDLVKETDRHRVHILDVHLQDLHYPADYFDVVIFDAPWYLGHLHYWLSLANKHVKPEGLVLFPMLRQLTRPSAEKDREILRTYASAVGSVTEDLEVVYETPKFEDEALSALGLGGLQEWRIANLVTVQIPAQKIKMNAPRPESGAWKHFRFGEQVVAIHMNGEDPRPLRVSSPYKDGSFISRSVSARAKELPLINLRTSRNRVAIVEGVDRIIDCLEILEQGRSPDTMIRDLSPDADEQPHMHRLTQLLIN